MKSDISFIMQYAQLKRKNINIFKSKCDLMPLELCKGISMFFVFFDDQTL